MTRSRRKWVAWLGLGLLLFLQLAVAAYACPAPQAIDVPMSPMDMSANEACDQPDKAPTKLCEQHCSQASQSVDTQPHGMSTVSDLPLIVFIDQPDPHNPITRDPHSNWLASAVDPPPLVRFGVLRI